jgi:hypothetical protein
MAMNLELFALVLQAAVDISHAGAWLSQRHDGAGSHVGRRAGNRTVGAVPYPAARNKCRRSRTTRRVPRLEGTSYGQTLLPVGLVLRRR